MAGDGDDGSGRAPESPPRDADDGPTQHWTPDAGPRSVRGAKVRPAIAAARFARMRSDDEPTSQPGISATPVATAPSRDPARNSSLVTKPKIPASERPAHRERKSTLKSARHGSTAWLMPAAVAALVLAGAALAWVSVGRRSATPARSAHPPFPPPPVAPEPDATDIDLSLRLTPMDATVSLDGERVEATSRIVRPCPLGHHVLRVEANGFVSETRRIPCHGLVVLDVRLTPAP
jgi:hypothetical protein